MQSQHVDILIVGAGMAGIGAACRLSTQFPHKSLAIIERRNAIGGTWDLFKYPGIRSDSDMFTYAYPFRPWQDPQILADGARIQRYIAETAREFGVDQKIRFGVRITRANWCSDAQIWTLTAQHEASAEESIYTCNYLIMCTGYYNHDAGYLPAFPGVAQYRGLFIHPQHWPEHLDYRDKLVVVIGSGATAVTLVPAMADQAAHVTMLQRSPSYIVSVPANDKISSVLKNVLPDSVVYGFARRRNLWKQRGLYLACKRWPKLMQRVLLSLVRKEIGKSVDMRHFTPSYHPWDQRLCAVPDNDLFTKIKSGKASVITDQIECFTETGLRLTSGKELTADIIITATGLNLQMLGGLQLCVDGEIQHVKNHLIYKGVLVQDLPNFAYLFGHANAPWTLKTDLAARYLCRLLTHMEAYKKTVVIPRATAEFMEDTTILDQFSSGYIQRGNQHLPRQGNQYPWKITHHYGQDKDTLLQQPITDKWLTFS